MVWTALSGAFARRNRGKEKSMEKCVLERLEKMRDFLSEKANYLKMERIKGISEQFVSNEGNINSVCSLTKFTDK